MQELSNFWRVTASDAENISGDFSPREFAAARHHLKPGKAPGSDYICPELVNHAGPGLKFCPLAFFFPACAYSKI